MLFANLVIIFVATKNINPFLSLAEEGVVFVGAPGGLGGGAAGTSADLWCCDTTRSGLQEGC